MKTNFDIYLTKICNFYPFRKHHQIQKHNTRAETLVKTILFLYQLMILQV